jgi:WD40 repeat protein
MQTNRARPGDESDWAAKLAIHPDGQTVALACGRWRRRDAPGVFLLWDLHSQTSRLLLRAQSAVYGVAFSPSGTLLATAHGSGDVILWDTASGKQLWKREFPDIGTCCVKFAPDGNRLAVGDATNSRESTHMWFHGATIKFLDVGTGQLQHETQLPGSAALSLAYFPSGDRLAVGGGQWGRGTIHILNAKTGEVTTKFRTKSLVTGLDLSPDGDRLAIADFRTGVWMWDTDSNTPPQFLARHGFIHDLAYSSDGLTVASGSRLGTVKLWNVATGRELTRLSVGNVSAFGLKFSADGSALVAARGDRGLVQWKDGKREEYSWPRE